MLPDIHRATQKFYIFLIVYLTGCTPISFSEFIYLFKHSLVRTATASKAIAAAAVATAAFGFSLCPCNMGV